MKATAGDRLVVKGHHIRDPDREAVILEVHGQHGTGPYLVRWTGGHESVFMPSSDTFVEHHPAPRASA